MKSQEDDLIRDDEVKRQYGKVFDISVPKIENKLIVALDSCLMSIKEDEYLKHGEMTDKTLKEISETIRKVFPQEVYDLKELIF